MGKIKKEKERNKGRATWASEPSGICVSGRYVQTREVGPVFGRGFHFRLSLCKGEEHICSQFGVRLRTTCQSLN